MIRGLVEVTEQKEVLRYSAFDLEFFNELSVINTTQTREITYSPNNPILRDIMFDVTSRINDFQFAPVSFPNPDALEGDAIARRPYASIEFDQSYQNFTSIEDFPDEIKYAVRFPAELRTNITGSDVAAAFSQNWATNIRFGLDFIPGARNRNSRDGGNPPGYIRQGFSLLQNLIDRAIIRKMSDNPNVEFPDLFIRRMPFPEYVNDILGLILEFAIPLIFMVAFLYSAINNIKYIAVEREMQLKEAMKIMGLPGYMHWIAWFTKCMTFQIIIISVITGLVKIPFASRSGLAVFTHTHWSILWVFFFIYALAGVTFSFMFSTFFSKANTCAIVGAIAWLLMLQPYQILNINYATTPLGVKLGFSMFVNTGMGFGFKVLGRYESALIGVQWDNLFSPVTPDDDLTLGYIMIVLLIASLVQMLLALYIEKIKPGQYGVPEPWYFPVLPSFWCGSSKSSQTNIENNMIKSNPNFETEPMDKNVGIMIRNLRKVYNRNKVAVDDLNLNIFEDQITVLLGHNGAGKSTTMSMVRFLFKSLHFNNFNLLQLTGLFPPTSGTAYINGYDIRTSLSSIRGSLGLCPQHNVLFNELTVREHIIFFTKLKGFKEKKDIDQQIEKYVNLLGLQPKTDAQAHTLSGGMKRKLSIGIALCGNSKIVMIDEASSGMDPAARRQLWDILIQEKKGRTILLTTHFMDEADVLGDRIAIMADGQLKTGKIFKFKMIFN
jgi:ATP-binding cassette subfamily A (ABC1) protein 3